MNQQNTRRRSRAENARETDGPGPDASHKDDLLAQARGFGEAAREARGDCPRGAEAEREADARQNASGQ